MSNRLIKFTGRLTVDTQSVTVERVDAGASGNPAASVSLANGDYYILGRTAGIVNGAQTDTDITVDAGHDLVVGDVVTVYDVSGDTALATARTITASSATEVSISGAAVTVATGDRIYVEADLLSELFAKMSGEHNGDFGTLYASIDSTGIVTLATTGTVEIDLQWDTDDLQTWLRYSTDLDTAESATIDATAQQAERTHAFGFYPSKLNIEDKPSTRAQRSISVATDGTQETIYLAKQERLLLTVRYNGGPRSYTWREIHAFDDFWSRAVQGIPFRYYASSSQERPYQVKVYPYGWKTYTLESPETWEPREITAGWYEHFQENLVLLTYTG